MKRSGNIKKTVWRNRSIKHLKTILALLLALVLVLSLAACGEEKPGTGKSKKDDDESSEKDERDDDDDEDSRGGKAYGLYVKDDELYYTDLSKTAPDRSQAISAWASPAALLLCSLGTPIWSP